MCVRLGAYGVYSGCQVVFAYNEKVLSHFGNCYSLRCVPFCSRFTTVGEARMVTVRGKKVGKADIQNQYKSILMIHMSTVAVP